MKNTFRLICLGLLTALHLTAALSDTLAKKSSFGYDDQGFLIRETVEPDLPNYCLTTNYTLDGFGNKVSKVTSSCSGVSGQSAWSAGARTTTSTFSADGNFPLTTTNALGHSETRTFTAGGLMSSLVGPNGLTTTWEYDGFGRRTKETRADGTYTTWSYVRCPNAGANCPSSVGGVAPQWVLVEKHLRTTGSPNWPEQRQFFDAQNRILRVQKEGFTDAQGSIPVWVQDTEYDALGRIARKSNNYDPAASTPLWSEFTYDILGRIVQERRPSSDSSGNFATTTYQYNGLTSSVINPANQTQTTIKNAQGQPVSVVDAGSNSVAFAYDAEGNVTSTNASGSIVTLAYDQRGNKVSMLDPAMGAWSYSYNVFGELVYQTDSLSRPTTNAYDKLGRLVKRTEADLVSDWSFDKMFDGSACGKSVGVLCEAKTDNGYRRVLTYDSLGRVVSNANSLDSSPTLATVSVTYSSESGRIAYRTWPTGFQAAYSYTSRGYPQHVAGGGSAAFPETLTMTVDAMDPNGNITAYRQGGQLIKTDKVFNKSTGVLTSQNVTKDGMAIGGMLKHAYTYDSLDNLLQRADDSAGVGIRESFSYDSLNRVREYIIIGSGISPPKTTSVLYDTRGNITYKSDVGQYVYDVNRPNRLMSISLGTASGGAPNTGTRALTFTFDDSGGKNVNGLPTGNGSVTETVSQDVANARYTYRRQSYTSFNMPQTAVFGTILNGTVGPAQRTLSFVYGPEHQRIKQQVQLGSGAPNSFKASTTWYLNGEDSLGLTYEKEVFVDGLIEHRHYLTMSGLVFAVRSTRSGVLGGQPATSGRYFHHDHLGSVVAVSDEAGAVVERLAFDPWGKRRFANGNPDPLDQIVGQSTSRGYTMHEHLDEIGAIHMNGRIYDPLIGRFLSADSFVQSAQNLQSYNRYSYVLNNPLVYTDPTGHFSLKRLVRGIVGAVVGYFVGPWFGGFFQSYGPLATNIATGAAGGFTGGLISSGTLKGGLYGGLSGGAFRAVGYYGESGAWSTTSYVAAHAAVGCLTESIAGGSCKGGAISAGFSKWATVEGQDYGDVGNGIRSVVVGGTASVLAGGKFEDGAITAAYGYIFNQLRGGLGPVLKGARGFAAMASDMSTAGYQLVEAEVWGRTGAGDRFRVDGVFMDKAGNSVMGSASIALCESKCGPTSDASERQVRIYNAVAKNDFVLEGPRAAIVAAKAGLSLNAEGQLRIPSERFTGVYLGVYEGSNAQFSARAKAIQFNATFGGIPLRGGDN